MAAQAAAGGRPVRAGLEVGRLVAVGAVVVASQEVVVVLVVARSRIMFSPITLPQNRKQRSSL